MEPSTQMEMCRNFVRFKLKLVLTVYDEWLIMRDIISWTAVILLDLFLRQTDAAVTIETGRWTSSILLWFVDAAFKILQNRGQRSCNSLLAFSNLKSIRSFLLVFFKILRTSFLTNFLAPPEPVRFWSFAFLFCDDWKRSRLLFGSVSRSIQPSLSLAAILYIFPGTLY
jgi:hypothetical protein